MNNDRPLHSLPPRAAEDQELFESQLAACGTETLLETGCLVEGQWVIRVCPRCFKMASELGGSRSGCPTHNVADYNFIRVLVKTVAEPKPDVVLPDVTLDTRPRQRPSELAERTV